MLWATNRRVRHGLQDTLDPCSIYKHEKYMENHILVLRQLGLVLGSSGGTLYHPSSGARYCLCAMVAGDQAKS
jgi:hypothetical protein